MEKYHRACKIFKVLFCKKIIITIAIIIKVLSLSFRSSLLAPPPKVTSVTTGIKKINKCTSRESNPGLYRGRVLFYH